MVGIARRCNSSEAVGLLGRGCLPFGRCLHEGVNVDISLLQDARTVA